MPIKRNAKNPINTPAAGGIASRKGELDGINKQLQNAIVTYATTTIAIRNTQV